MSNKLRGMVAIKLDKARNLKFGTNALRELEESLGFKIMELSNISLGFREIQAFIYHGLRHEDKELTFEATGDLMDEAESLDYVISKMSEALTLALNKKSGSKPQTAGE